MTFEEWAARWQISEQALTELRQISQCAVQTTDEALGETDVSNMIRMEATRKGGRLWRNNVGALKDENGRFVRFGLANTSARVNAELKSADLIGCMPIKVDAGMVGCTFGQFVAVEVKRPGWRYTGTGREPAQANFLTLIESLGGRGFFATGEGGL